MPDRPDDKNEVLQHPFHIEDAFLHVKMRKLRGFVKGVDLTVKLLHP